MSIPSPNAEVAITKRNELSIVENVDRTWFFLSVVKTPENISTTLNSDVLGYPGG